MKTTVISLLIALVIPSLGQWNVIAFSSGVLRTSVAYSFKGTKLLPTFRVGSPLLKKQQRCISFPPLRYREHDDSDSDTTLIKLESRTPSIGYDVKKEVQQAGPQISRTTGLNQPLVKALLLNQVITIVVGTVVAALTLVFSDGFGALGHFSEITQWVEPNAGLFAGVNPIVLGAIGSIPSIVIGNFVENSDEQAFANTNFSTIIMVQTLFGRRRAPPDEFLPPQVRGKPFPSTKTLDVALVSAALATATAIAEETVFRSNVPGLLSHFNNDNLLLALFGQAFLFGLGHISPKSDLKENAVVAGLQATNGLSFGLLYILSGGDLLACIVAHAIYDFQVFFLTWLSSNAQIEYSEDKYLEPLPNDVKQELMKVGGSGRDNDKLLAACKRLFYTFDFDKNKSLSLSEVRKGIAYLWLEKGTLPPPNSYIDQLFRTFAVTDGSRMRLPEFTKLFMTLEQRNRAGALV